MDFEFSEDQQLIGEQANAFLKNECTSEVVRKVLDGDAPYDKELWKKIAELGWLGAAIPEEYGGLGLSYLELAVIAEAMGRALAPVPFSSSVYLATEFLLAAGSEAQKQEWLPKLAAGEVIGTAATKGTLTLDSSGSISGQLPQIPDAEIADFCIVMAVDSETAESGNSSLHLIELNQEEATVTPATPIDLSRNCADITFTAANTTPLSESDDGKATLDNVLTRAAVLYAWEQLGGSDAALQQARDYAMERFAFGRPIASFQAIKHKLAQAYVNNTLAKSNCYYAIWALDTNSPELTQAAATARVSTIQAYYYSSKENIQTHGGMGFTWEFDCHLHYRRAKSLSLVIGGENTWKRRLIGAVL